MPKREAPQVSAAGKKKGFIVADRMNITNLPRCCIKRITQLYARTKRPERPLMNLSVKPVPPL